MLFLRYSLAIIDQYMIVPAVRQLTASEIFLLSTPLSENGSVTSFSGDLKTSLLGDLTGLDILTLKGSPNPATSGSLAKSLSEGLLFIGEVIAKELLRPPIL